LRSLEVIENDTIRFGTNDCLLTFHSNGPSAYLTPFAR